MIPNSAQTRTVVTRMPSGRWRWSVLEFDISIASGMSRTQHQARADAAAAKRELYANHEQRRA